MTLYDMTEAAERLKEMLEADEIDEQTFADTLESIGAAEKVNSYCQIITEFAGESVAIDAEIERLQRKLERNKRNIERMKAALDNFMQAAGKDKEKTPLFSVSYRKCVSVDVIDASAVPEEYTKVKTERHPDKAAIKAALKAGEDVAGCALKTEKRIQIR